MDFIMPQISEAAARWLGLALVVGLAFLLGIWAHKRWDDHNTIECLCEDDDCSHCHPPSTRPGT